MGFEIEQFPQATRRANLDVAERLAFVYRNTNSNDREIRSAMSETLRGICAAVRDPRHKPAGRARRIAETARRRVGRSETDFAQTLAVAAAESAQGGKRLTAYEDFVERAEQICRSQAHRITDAVREVTAPGEAFRSSDAIDFSLKVGPVPAEVRDLSETSKSAKASAFATDLAKHVRDLDRQAATLGALNQDGGANPGQAMAVRASTREALMALSKFTGEVETCGEVFTP